MNWGLIFGITLTVSGLVFMVSVVGSFGYMQGERAAYKRGLDKGIEIARQHQEKK